MNPFSTSRDDGRRTEAYGPQNRSRHGSNYYSGHQRSYSGDVERFGRAQSASTRADMERFDREQYGHRHESGNRYHRSPSRRFEHSGSLDRQDYSRRNRFASGQRGDYYGDRHGKDFYGDRHGRGYGDERFGDRYARHYDGDGYGYRPQKDGAVARQDDSRYGYDRPGYGYDRYDRCGFGSDRYGYGNDRYGYNYRQGGDRHGYDSHRQGGDRHGYDSHRQGGDRHRYDSHRQGYGDRYGFDRHGYSDRYAADRYSYRSRHGSDRYGYGGNRHGMDRGHFDYRHDRDPRDQHSRVRFDGERNFRGDFRRGSMSDLRDYDRRRDAERRHDMGGRDKSWPTRRSGDVQFRDSQYRTDGMTNVNRRFEGFSEDRPSSRSRGANDREDRRYEMQGGSQYRGGGQFGSKMGSDRMPPPIPPFSEPRSNYPATLALTWDDEERYGQSGTNRCRELAVRATYDLMRRRYYERAADPSQNPTWLQRGARGDSYNSSPISPDVLRIDVVDFKPTDNSKEHRTFEYELVKDQEQPTPVFRRGQTFVMSFNFRDREFDTARDNLYLNFYFGPNPSVPKRTRVVLPVVPGTEFQRVPYQWDARVTNQEGNHMTVEVHIPASCPVGMWRCVLETSTRESPSSRLQYRCPEDIYIIFNPFDREDPVYMESDEQRFEYVINDCGKVYTGGYRNIRGRPWIYGQFDDCVLPAACVLLEMSGLSHAERGNPIKVARALASMIKASRSNKRSSSFWENGGSGLIEARFEDDYRGGNSPHLWTGSVQIIEEFLRGGASPVKYAQCWVMAGLMTTLCRTLGLPSRPVTAYVSALDTQDSLTVDRYIDRFGDVLEHGPSRDQPDSIWSFHTWCDVWMIRPDQPQGYSGWQATDPCRTYRDFRDLFSGSCGPCPIEALRRGDIGQRDDVDAFYASLNSYVRYFYEDDESGWGYSPFRQFRFPVCRYILTKAVGRYDDEGDNDCDDLTNVYRDNERSNAERFAIFNSCRGIQKDTPAFEYQAAAFQWGSFNPNQNDQSEFDITFELDAPERVMIGQAVVVPVVVSNTAAEPRTIQTNICTRSSFYTGTLGPYLKRSSTQLTLGPNQQETITLTLDPWDYEDKLVDMSFVKITVTGFVQETGHSFVDEFDFRFNKPWLNIEVPEIRNGEECEATFSFTNPLEVPLTDCFLTMEISGSVRPRTIRIDREVRPRENFTFTQTFVPRATGERRMVACFASRQLQDVVGQRPIVVRE